MKAITFEKVSKSFKDKHILNQVSLELDDNKIYGFVGPNGSGKTTTIKMMLGLTKIDSGNIQIFNEKVTFGSTPTNKLIGYLPDVPEFYDYMTATEYLKLCSGFSHGRQPQQVEALLEEVGLKNNKQLITTYSRGMKQRLGLAQALIHNPKILICDEPTSALDPKGRQDILELISNLRGKKTVIFSTHILSDVEKICDDVLILSKHTIQNLNQLKTCSAEKEKVLYTVMLKVKKEDRPILDKHFQLEEDENKIKIYLPAKKSVPSNDILKDFYQKLMELGVFPTFIEAADESLEQLYLEVIS
ncbi:ABC transporter ATP-binding protein [Streptococcus orisasini]